MSWAEKLKQNNAATGNLAEPQHRVYAADPTLNESERALRNTEHHTVRMNLPHYEKALLILDANAFIKRLDYFLSTADALVTTPQVIREVKDRAARELLERLPQDLTVLDPTDEAISQVVKIAEKTGDLGVLSRTDIRLCALALDCCKAAGTLGTPIEPKPPVITTNSNIRVNHEEKDEDVFNAEGQEEEDEEDEDDLGEEGEEGDAEGEAAVDSWVGEGDEGVWITPENIHSIQEGAGIRGDRFERGMACVTSDFAMQNVLLHLGVPIVGTSGMKIRELRLWLLRCTACYAIVSDTTRQFCPDCGNGNTLRRVNYVVNSDGEKELFINFKKRISTRGTVYNLPKPRGGKNGTHRKLVLREDQLAQVLKKQQGVAAKESEVKKMLDEDDLATFGVMQRKKKKDLTEPKTVSSYHKYNVNEMRKARAARRK